MMLRSLIAGSCVSLMTVGLSQELQLPSLTGPHAVGTMTKHWIDEDRSEPATSDRDDKRELMVQFWYPAEGVPGGDQAYVSDVGDLLGDWLVNEFGLDPTFKETYRSFQANAISDAPIVASEAGYPLVIYSHGDSTLRTTHIFTCEELASRGYVVAAPAHTYNTVFVRFPDGRVIEGGPGQQHNSRVGDLLFILDRLQRDQEQKTPGSISTSLDLTRVGIMGYSLGGRDATEVLARDSRFIAGVSIDGFGTSSLKRPILFVNRSDNSQATGAWTAGGYIVKVLGTHHLDFSEYALIWEIGQVPGVSLGSGRSDLVKFTRSYTDFILAFFDKHLKGKRTSLLERNINQRNPNPEFSGFTFSVIRNPQRNAPEIRIQLEQSAGTITVKWPVEPDGFILQSADTLAGEWIAVEQEAISDQGVDSITLDLSTARRYFRLSRQ